MALRNISLRQLLKAKPEAVKRFAMWLGCDLHELLCRGLIDKLYELEDDDEP